MSTLHPLLEVAVSVVWGCSEDNILEAPSRSTGQLLHHRYCVVHALHTRSDIIYRTTRRAISMIQKALVPSHLIVG